MSRETKTRTLKSAKDPSCMMTVETLCLINYLQILSLLMTVMDSLRQDFQIHHLSFVSDSHSGIPTGYEPGPFPVLGVVTFG